MTNLSRRAESRRFHNLVYHYLKKIIILCFLISSVLQAQIKETEYVLDTPRDYKKYPALNSNYIEILGNGGLYSLNFDRIFLYRPAFKISGRAGAMIWPNGYNIEQGYVVENNYIFFNGDHHLEIGPGLTLQRKYNPSCKDTITYKWESIWFGMFRLGYRYQKESDGFFFRFGLTPIFYRKYDCREDLPPPNWFWLGIAVGMSY